MASAAQRTTRWPCQRAAPEVIRRAVMLAPEKVELREARRRVMRIATVTCTYKNSKSTSLASPPSTIPKRKRIQEPPQKRMSIKMAPNMPTPTIANLKKRNTAHPIQFNSLLSRGLVRKRNSRQSTSPTRAVTICCLG